LYCCLATSSFHLVALAYSTSHLVLQITCQQQALKGPCLAHDGQVEDIISFKNPSVYKTLYPSLSPQWILLYILL